MSEGDTVHLSARQIDAALAGRVPEEILTPNPRHRGDRWPERLAGRAVLGAQARGKHMLLHFEGDLALHSHLRMSGTWGVYPRGGRWHRAAHKAWLVLRCGDWEVVQFDGPVLELISELRLRSDRAVAGLGPDVFGESFDSALFLRRLARVNPDRTLGDALLDQSIVAGLGNVWKAEACFAVALDPWRPVGKVSREEALAVVDFVRGYYAGAARERDTARKGFAARPRTVYNRAGQPCPRCATTIRARGQGDHNRTTFWCPGCQH